MDEVPRLAKKESKIARSSQRSYLVMMLLSFFTEPFGLARVYRGDTSIGWGRFWMFVGTLFIYLISYGFIPFMAISGLILIGLLIWGVVDFFLLYGTLEDAEGEPLLRSELDARIAKVLFIIFIVELSVTLIAVILSLVFWSIPQDNMMLSPLRTMHYSTY